MPSTPSGRHLIEQGAVDVDAEAHVLGLADGRDGALEGARLGHGLVVMGFHAVQMDRESQIRRGRELAEVLFQKQGVGAQVDEFLARHDALDDFLDLLMDQGLAAGDRDDGCTTIIDRLQAFFHRQAFVQDVVFVIDLAAARAGQVAAEQGFQHQDEGVFLHAAQLFAHDIGADTDLLDDGDCHVTLRYLRPRRGGLCRRSIRAAV